MQNKFEEITLTAPNRRTVPKLNVKLIELFGGIGSQALAFSLMTEYFDINPILYKYCEIDENAVAVYNELHNTYYEPSDIRDWKGSDLGIKQDNSLYILTYSFPCQDMSRGGKGLGMSAGSNTRSSLLWEVGRLLEETEVLPRILIMENVPQVHSKKHIKDFEAWQKFLEDLGYKNFSKDICAAKHGYPQNRTRTFMISFLGAKTFQFQFPPETELKYMAYDLIKPAGNLLPDDKMKLFLSQFPSDCYSKDFEVLHKNHPNEQNFVKLNDYYISMNCDIGKKFKSLFNGDSLEHTVCVNSKGGRFVKTNGVTRFVKGLQPSLHDRIYLSNAVACTCTTSPFFMPYYCVPIKSDYGIFFNTIDDCIVLQCVVKELTPEDCFCLMGFDENDCRKAIFALVRTGRSMNIGNELIKQAGNSIVVFVLIQIFCQILDSAYVNYFEQLYSNEIEGFLS